MQSVPKVKTLLSAIHDIHVVQQATRGESGEAGETLYRLPTARHPAAVALKSMARRRQVVRETNGKTDLLRNTHADKLEPAQAGLSVFTAIILIIYLCIKL